jgi:hypothetical protein
MSLAPSIFSPINVGGYLFKNRLVPIPIYTGYSHPGGWVSNLILKSHREEEEFDHNTMDFFEETARILYQFGANGEID